MATIRKRGDKWQAQVRRQGCPPVSRYEGGAFLISEVQYKVNQAKGSARLGGDLQAGRLVPAGSMIAA